MPESTAAYLRIARTIAPGAVLRDHRPLAGGVSATVRLIEMELPGGPLRSVVVRSRPGNPWKGDAGDGEAIPREYALQRALHRAGFAVPEPLFVDVSRTVLPAPYFVMEYVDGTTVAADPEGVRAMGPMADLLSHLHRQHPRSLSLPALPRREDPVAGALGYLPETAANQPLRRALSALALPSVRDALVHGDFWPGNILWRDGRIAAVLDWEDAALGDPMSDLACARVEIACAFGEAAMDAFTRRYLAAAVARSESLPVWDVYVSLAALATMADWGLEPAVEARRRQRTADFLARASRDLLDLAAQ